MTEDQVVAHEERARPPSDYTGYRILPGWGDGPVAEFDRRYRLTSFDRPFEDLNRVSRFNLRSLETRIRNLRANGRDAIMEEEALAAMKSEAKPDA